MNFNWILIFIQTLSKTYASSFLQLITFFEIILKFNAFKCCQKRGLNVISKELQTHFEEWNHFGQLFKKLVRSYAADPSITAAEFLLFHLQIAMGTP